ncbi:MAG: hypothetical protein ACLGHQ_06280, partial [Acidimicrobiia bacterium]
MQSRRRALRALGTVTAIAAAAAVSVVVSPGGGRTVEAVAGSTLGAGGEFHPITPARIVDSRESLQLDGTQPTGPDGPVVEIDLAGLGGLPTLEDGFEEDVLAVVVNITVIRPSRAGFLRAFGTGTPEGDTSVVNFNAGERVPNSAILRPGTDGKISLRMFTPSGTGTAHLAVDVSGWFSSSSYGTNGARTVTIDPARIFDSRDPKFGAAPIGSLGQRELQIHGATKLEDGSEVVPDDPDVVGVILNLTGINRQPNSRITFASFIPEPVTARSQVKTSNLNLDDGQLRANLAIVPVPDDGTLTLFNSEGSTHLIVDVVGYLLEGAAVDTRAGRIVPLVAPFRAFDTRDGEHFAQRLGPARAEDWSFDDFVADVKIGTEPVGAQQGFFGNLTATGLQRRPDADWAPAKTFLTAYPSPATRPGGPPNVSNVNLGEGSAVPNMALMRYGTTAD